MSTSESQRVRTERLRSLFDEHFRHIYATARIKVGADHADDITAEVFFIAWKRLDHFDPSKGSARSWLDGIARKVIANHVRSDQRWHAQQAAALRTAQRHDGTTDPIEDDDVSSEIALAMSPVDRQLATLIADGHSIRDASHDLGISPVAGRSRLHRLREKLRGSRHNPNQGPHHES